MLQNSEYAQEHWSVHFKRVNSVVCTLYLNIAVIKTIKERKLYKVFKNQNGKELS